MVKVGQTFTWIPGSGAIRTTQAEAVAGPTESLEPAKRRRMEGSDSRDISASMGPGFIHRYAEESMKPRGQITEIQAALEGIAGHHRGWAPVTAEVRMTAGNTDFFMVPNSVIDEAGLSAHEKAVFAVLARHRNKSTNECFPGLAKINARLTPASKPTVIKAIRGLLLEKGLISMRVEGEKHLQRHIYSFPDLQTGKARLQVKAMETGQSRFTGCSWRAHAKPVMKTTRRKPVKRRD